MRLAFGLTLLLGVLMTSLFFIFPTHDSPPAPPVVERPTPKDPKNNLSSSLIDLRSSSGRHLFAPSFGEAVIDGKTETYQALLLWCDGLGPKGEARFEVSDVRALVVTPPKTREELAALPSIPLETPPSQIGDEVTRLIDLHGSGFLATRAVFSGGRDLASASQAELLDGFEVRFRERDGEKRHARFLGQRARVVVENGRLLSASSDQPVVIETSAGIFKGVGFSVDAKTGTYELKRDLEGELSDLSLLGRTGDPLQFRAQGPLRFTAARPPREGELFVREGRLLLDGNVVLEQARSRLRGSRFEGDLSGAKTELRVASLEGPVALEIPEGTLFGSRATWNAPGAPGGRLIVFGAPLRATLKDGARLLPTALATGDLELESSSQAVVDGLAGDELIPKKIEVGNDIVLRAHDTLVTGRQLRVFLERISVLDAEAGASAGRDFPTRIELEGPLEGKGPLGRFAGKLLTFNRQFSPDGLPLQDTIDLWGTPFVSYLLPAVVKTAAPEEKGRVEALGLFDGAGRVEITASEHLRVERDPLRVKPLLAQAVGKVVTRRFGEDPKADAIGTFRAERGEIVLEEEWTALDGGARFEVKRRLARGAAEGSLEAEVPGVFRGSGHRLEFDARALSAALDPETGGRVQLRFQDEDQRWHDLTAGGLKLLESGTELRGFGGVLAQTWITPVRIQESAPAVLPAVLVETRLEGQEARLIFDVEAGTNARKRSIHQLHADGQVKIRQPGRLEGACDHVEIDRLLRSVHMVGAPVAFSLVELIEGRSGTTRLEAPAVTALADQLLVRGPFTADFPVEAGTIAIDLGAPAPRAASPAPLSNLRVAATGDLVAAPETWILKGPATITLGDPTRDGFQVVGNRVVLFPTVLPDTPPKLSAKFGRGLVEGQVSYQSTDFSGQGDVMEFDRDRKQIELWSLENSATLSLPKIGIRDYRRPAFRINFSDPNRPYFDSIARPERSAPR